MHGAILIIVRYDGCIGAVGGCCSGPEEKYEAKPNAGSPKAKPPTGQASTSKKPSTPDFGLAATHEVVKLLGKGGDGETWLLKVKETGEEVAIKLIKRPIPKAALAVIKREIKIQADLGQGHMNIVSADEVVLSKTHLGLVMEYVPGEHARHHACPCVCAMRLGLGHAGDAAWLPGCMDRTTCSISPDSSCLRRPPPRPLWPSQAATWSSS